MRERETERSRDRVRAYDKRVVRDGERKSVCDVERQREIERNTRKNKAVDEN